MISLVIPTYNEEKSIERCLLSLESQTIPRNNYEIIVVDGQSTDNTVEIAKKYADKVIHQKSKGVGGARNDGVAVAKHDLIATSDADCTMPEDWLEKIVQAFEAKDVVLVSGKVKLVESTPLISTSYYITEKVWHLMYVLKISHFLCGANTAFRKKEFMEIGGYSNIPILDDFEISMRMKNKGDMKYARDIYIYYSTRRLKKEGLKKNGSLWIYNWLRLHAGLPVKSINYAKQNYED